LGERRDFVVEVEVAVGGAEALLLQRRELEQLRVGGGGGEHEHAGRQRHRQPRERRHDVRVERLQPVQVVDHEQDGRAALHPRLAGASHQRAEPVVDVQRIKTAVLGDRLHACGRESKRRV
jgi:hypothetical protein